TWQDLIVHIDGVSQPLEPAHLVGRVDEWDGDRPVVIEGVLLAAPGEEPDWDTPRAPVDWTGLRAAVEAASLYRDYPEHARPTAAELEELRAYHAMAAAEERGLRERGEWSDIVEAARDELEASGWHRGTAVRAVAARLDLTHRTAEHAVEEALEAAARE
ncbi:MAG TPA: hypothetical protein VF188_00900, partial [Longimicrobiales bacterium]